MKRKLTVICIAALLLSACGGKGQNEKAVESGEAVVAGEKIEQGLEAKESESVFRESLQEENGVNLDDYVGYYTNGSYDEVKIEKDGNGYSMEVGLYRLTTIDEGTVSASAEGVVFDALDAGGNPIRLTFYKNEAGSYTLRVDETTWTYLQNGDTVENMVRTTYEEAYPQAKSDLADGKYDSRLTKEDESADGIFVTGMEFYADCVTVDAGFRLVDDEYSEIGKIDKGTYMIVIDAGTRFLASGGDSDALDLGKDGFEEYIGRLSDSGLGLYIEIENGVAKVISIFS